MPDVNQRPTHPQVLKVEHTESGYLLHLSIPDDLLYLEGHFPQMPIVAGVCQLKWVIDYIQTYTGAPLQITAFKDIKFLRPLFPNQSCVMELIYVPHEPSWRYQIYANTQRFSSGSLLVQPA